jgi:hypothetical protein
MSEAMRKVLGQRAERARAERAGTGSPRDTRSTHAAERGAEGDRISEPGRARPGMLREAVGRLRTEAVPDDVAATRLLQLMHTLREEAARIDRDSVDNEVFAKRFGTLAANSPRHRVVEQQATFAPEGTPEPAGSADAKRPGGKPRKWTAADAKTHPIAWAQHKGREMLNLPRDGERLEKAHELLSEANSSGVPLVALESLADVLTSDARDASDAELASEIGERVAKIKDGRLTNWATEAHRLPEDKLRAGLADMQAKRKDGAGDPDDVYRARYYVHELAELFDQKVEQAANATSLAGLQKGRVDLYRRWRDTRDPAWRHMFQIVDRVFQERIDTTLYQWARSLSLIESYQLLERLGKVKHGKQHAERIRVAIRKAQASHTRHMVEQQRIAREKQREYFNRMYPALRGDFVTAAITWSTGDPELGQLLGGLFGVAAGGVQIRRGLAMRRSLRAGGGAGSPGPEAPPAPPAGGGEPPRRTAHSTATRTRFKRPSDPVVERARSTGQPDDFTPTGSRARAIGEAERAAERAAKATDRLGAARKEKVTAGGRETELRPGVIRRQTRVSGWTPIPERKVAVDPQKVADRAKQIGHQLRPAGARDGRPQQGGFVGKSAASHAEKQQIVAHPNDRVGVSAPMCADCIRFFQKEAIYQKRAQVVSDPEVTRVFARDGSITEHWRDGMRVQRAPDGRSVKVRPTPRAK